ncbi:P48 [Alphabaculovirus altermyunipunctae]|uniref:P48 n=1 Tax=Mythimna unipuncta nucleopolyhedrovirus TaxID=447897 RepID=A0A346TPN4_9ABAC|nr:P48 [Mythimna unipuncta nucleopolyhedrovirus]AXU41544.1 P48 [Mythimna unipuncta nucleopolyhedrovirus]
MEKYLIDYCLRFNLYDDFKNVSFGANLTKAEIDSLSFLFSVYFDQKERVYVKGLTFFTEFNKCVELIKHNFENKPNNSNDVKQIFSLFLRDEFMNQVPNFQTIMNYLKRYYKPILKPDIDQLLAMCASCGLHRSLQCFTCKCRYLSASITAFDIGIQDGWDMFLRPMFGLPVYMVVLLNTDFSKHDVAFNLDDMITHAFAQFFYNLLCDKASSMYTNRSACNELVRECQKVTVGLSDRELEMLLSSLNSHSYHTKLFSPFKRFMEDVSRCTKIKKINKIASVIFTGFYLRNYLEAAPNKTFSAAELEVRNVCRLILKQYTHEQYETFIVKLKKIKNDLSIGLMSTYIITEDFIRRLCTENNLDQDIATLLENTKNE